MLPLVGIPATIVKFLESYRQVFRKEAGFKHISRYINGLLMSPNKTLQGIYSQLVWNEQEKVSRRAMHEAVFEAGWKHEELMQQHRKIISPLHQGKGREIIALDWTFSYHPLTEVIEENGKHWVTEIERSRNVMWGGQWQRVERVAEELKTKHPESFRHKLVRCRNAEQREIWAFTKVVRLKKYGRKRLVIVHEKSDLSDTPRFLLTDALHWDASRVFATWSYRWSVEIFHEFSKQLVGFESAQLRNEEAVKRHFCLSCVAQSALQQASCSGKKSEKFNLTLENESTIGQRLYTLSREALHNLLQLSHSLLFQGQSTEQILEVMMPS